MGYYMVNTQQLSKTIESLENEVAKFKSISELYQLINSLEGRVEENFSRLNQKAEYLLEILAESSSGLGQTVAAFDSLSESIKTFLLNQAEITEKWRQNLDGQINLHFDKLIELARNNNSELRIVLTKGLSQIDDKYELHLNKAKETLEEGLRDYEQTFQNWQNGVNERFASQHERLTRLITETHTELKIQLAAKLTEIQDNNDAFHSAIRETLYNKLEEFRKENGKYQLYLEETIKSWLERNKSDIVVEIRNEGMQIQKSLESDLKGHLISIEKALTVHNEGITKKFKTQKVIGFFIIIIFILNLALTYWKIF